MERIVAEEVIARPTPEAQAIIRLLLAKLANLEAELKERRRQVKGVTPQAREWGHTTKLFVPSERTASARQRSLWLPRV